ncbi:hypothetical protein HYV80_05580 [Candidatus Woesearchaeota archaeon]|nr:hypothetical protein [Candidatus Woesearchaeota archaeon]
MAIFDRFRGRDRIDDPEKARKLAQREERARNLLEEAKEEALTREEFERLARKQGLKVSGQGNSGNLQEGPKDKEDEEAKGQGRIPQFIIKSVITNGSFWKKFIIILLIITAIIAFDIYGWGLSHIILIVNIILPFAVKIGFVLWIIVLILCFGYGIKKAIGERDLTVLFCTGVLAIWLMDRLGKVHTGFNFDWFGTLRTDWLTIGSSAVIMLGLAIFTFKGALKDMRMFILGFITLVVIFRGLNWIAKSSFFGSLNISYGTLGFVFLALIFGISMYLSRGWLQVESYWSFLLMLFILSYFWINFNWTIHPDGSYNWKAIIHMLFILAFGLLYVSPLEKNPTTWHLFMPAMIILDFFFYDLISDSSTFGFFPILPLLVLGYCVERKKDAFATLMLILVAAFILFILAYNVTGLPANFGNVQYQSKAEAGEMPNQNIIDKITDELKSAIAGIGQGVTGRLDVATGGLYSAQVEKNQFEPLGVFLDKVRASQPRFYPDEPVTIWSSIKSRTLSDPVSVRFNCYRYGKDNKRIGIKDDSGVLNPSEGEIIPKNPFTVFTLEEKDVECTFNQDPKNQKFQAGTNPITLSAQYNFVTSAYQEVRFIDRNRYQAMIKENLDPLKEFGITNKNPNTIYTNGPVEIKMVIQNPVTVDLTSKVLPNLGITLANRDKITDSQNKVLGQWKGKILNIEELAIIVPKGIKIAGAGCKPVQFIDYKKEDCLKSCIKTCKDTCKEFENPADQSQKISCEASRCDNNELKAKCDNECTVLFRSDSGTLDYEGYQLDTNFIKTLSEDKKKNVFENIGRNSDFGCRLTLDQDILEEGVSITRKYIRVRAKYNYLLESTYSVPIEQIPESTTVAHITYTPSNTDIDTYLNEKKSPIAGVGQCMKDTEQRTKIPILLMLGVAGQENSYATDSRSIISKPPFYNLFSIQCTDSYINSACSFLDKSQCCGRSGTKNYNWRRYADYCESINDFANLISNPIGRYAEAMKYKDNPSKMVEEMMKAGYAEEGQSWADGVNNLMTSAAARISTIAKTSESKAGG